MNVRRTETHGPDTALLGIIIALCVVGLLMVFSSSISERREPTYYFFHQVQNMVVGAVALIVATMIDYHVWRRFAYLSFGLAIVLLIAVHFVGDTVEGSQRWLGSRSFQPSEAAKIAVILFAAEWLPRKGDDVRTLGYGLFPFALMIGFVVALIFRQPDAGTAIVILATAGALFIVAGADLLQTAIAAAIAGVVFLATALPYQHDRIGSFWAPCQAAGEKTVAGLPGRHRHGFRRHRGAGGWLQPLPLGSACAVQRQHPGHHRRGVWPVRHDAGRDSFCLLHLPWHAHGDAYARIVWPARCAGYYLLDRHPGVCQPGWKCRTVAVHGGAAAAYLIWRVIPCRSHVWLWRSTQHLTADGRSHVASQRNSTKDSSCAC